MKNWAMGVMAITLLATTVATSQPPERSAGSPRAGRDGEMRGGRGPHGPGRPGPPQAMGLFGILDADGDGILSAEEIAAAPKVLGALDANQDGNVTPRKAHQAMARKSRGSTDGTGRHNVQRPRDQRPGSNPRGPFPADRPRPEGGRGDGVDGPRGPRPPRADAERPWGPRMVERLMQLDADEDGKLSADELPGRLARMLEQIDTNQDGFADADELKAFGERMRDRNPEGRRTNRPQRERGADTTPALDAT